MSEYQFPPSSPVTHDHERSLDLFPKNTDSVRGRFEYPTPQPSSTLGRSSSPARHEEERKHDVFNVEEPKDDEKLFNIVDPATLVMKIPLLDAKPQCVIGRSSQSCDYHIPRAGKGVSRVHVQVSHTPANMTIKCLGYNGFGMIVPYLCEVVRLKEQSNFFELKPTKKPIRLANVLKSVRLDHSHTEFHVSRGETVCLPRLPNVLVQISDKVLLINPESYDEEVTDDEAPQLIPQTKPAAEQKPEQKPEQKEPKNLGLPRKLEQPKEQPKLEQKPEQEQQVQKEQHVEFATPKGTVRPVPLTPHKTEHKITLEEPTPIRNHDDPRKKKMKKAATPPVLKEKSLNVPPPAKKRAVSEEPESHKKRQKQKEPVKEEPAEPKEPARDADGKLIIDPTCIQHITNVTEILNILVNHLAFSRLLLTPALYLNTISAVVAKLTLEELRAVLHQVSCIGVIYRLGKDAAGKPLEEEYYYVPEKDGDSERTKLVSSVKGSGGLRSCRRVHKQYYWKKPAPIKK